jgi:23S rRNA (guanine745-N1)-methyltransferase
MLSLFLCPICHSPLTCDERRYFCPAGHSYDVAASGYTYLLPANRKNSRAPGDDRGMAAARNRFLSGGYYAPLAAELSALCLTHTPAAPVIIDSGCGEGYYTAAVSAALSAAGREPRVAGIDISKECLRRAAKRGGAEYAVASAYALPFADGCADALINCFSPLAENEFRRVLKPGGVFLYVVPGARHLWELKSAIYDEPYENDEHSSAYDGFEYLEVRPVRATAHLPNQAVIHDLFEMTPYFWKTPAVGRERAEKLQELDITIEFNVHVMRRCRRN